MSVDSYSVHTVLRATMLRDETMGTKEKFWYRDCDGETWLFKFARSNTGEHWSEKIAAELGAALGISCASVELAVCEERLGSISRSFVELARADLVHGNELLQKVDETYPKVQLRGVSKHTVTAVLDRLDSVQPPILDASASGLTSAADWFVGYLLLDALIGNSDRHHENWGVLRQPDGSRVLAPSYDHASSLGRELTDQERSRRLHTSDPAFSVSGYAERARSGLYSEAGAARPLHPTEAFELAGRRYPTAMAYWLGRLRQMTAATFDHIVERIPDRAMSHSSREFALSVLRYGHKRLLGTDLDPIRWSHDVS